MLPAIYGIQYVSKKLCTFISGGVTHRLTMHMMHFLPRNAYCSALPVHVVAFEMQFTPEPPLPRAANYTMAESITCNSRYASPETHQLVRWKKQRQQSTMHFEPLPGHVIHFSLSFRLQCYANLPRIETKSHRLWYTIRPR